VERSGVSKAGSYATRILSITDIMQISPPFAPPECTSLPPSFPSFPRFCHYLSFTLQHFIPNHRIPRRSVLALQDTLVSRATCQASQRMNYLLIYGTELASGSLLTYRQSN